MHHYYHVTFHFLFPLSSPSGLSFPPPQHHLFHDVHAALGRQEFPASWYAILSWNAKISLSKDGFLKNKMDIYWLSVRTRRSLPYLLVCWGSTVISVGWSCKIFSPEQISFHLTNAHWSSEYSHNFALNSRKKNSFQQFLWRRAYARKVNFRNSLRW